MERHQVVAIIVAIIIVGTTILALRSDTVEGVLFIPVVILAGILVLASFWPRKKT